MATVTLDKVYAADIGLDLAAGAKLKLMADEDKVVDEKVPTGKRWAVTVKLQITEYAAEE